MKRLFISIALFTLPLLAMADRVNVNINLGADDYYGPVLLEGVQPQLVYSTPIVITPGTVVGSPLYLRVPTTYHSNWSAYCCQYSACNRQVYFVSDSWYRTTYIPRYRQVHPDWAVRAAVFDGGRRNVASGQGYRRNKVIVHDVPRRANRETLVIIHTDSRHNRYWNREDRGDYWDRGNRWDYGDRGNHWDRGNHGHRWDRGNDQYEDRGQGRGEGHHRH